MSHEKKPKPSAWSKFKSKVRSEARGESSDGTKKKGKLSSFKEEVKGFARKAKESHESRKKANKAKKEKKVKEGKHLASKAKKMMKKFSSFK